MAIPFISSTDLAEYTGYVLDPDKALIAVDSACDMLRSLAEQTWEYKEDDVVLLDSDGTDSLFLPELPVYEVSSVEGPGGIAASHFVDLEYGIIKTQYPYQRFLRGRGIYEVTYTHGYVSQIVGGMPPNVEKFPSDLRVLALVLAMRIYDQQIVQQESVGGAQYIYSSKDALGLSDREMDVLQKYMTGRRRSN